jgi:hypothetical protein
MHDALAESITNLSRLSSIVLRTQAALLTKCAAPSMKKLDSASAKVEKKSAFVSNAG